MLKTIKTVQPFSEARWISAQEETQTQPVEDSHFVFRHCLSLKEEPTRALIRLTADARYMLWVNGQFVGRGPARGYPFAQPYDEFDLAPFLSQGENWLAAQVYQFGPGVGAFGLCDKGNGIYVSTGKAGLLMEGEVRCADSAAVPILTDATWQARRADWQVPVMAPYIQGCFGFQEFKDARRELVGWQTGVESEGWQPAVEVAVPGEAPWTGFEPRGLKPMRETPVCPLPLAAAFSGANGAAVNEHKSLKTLWEEEKLDAQICLPVADADGWVQVTPPAEGFVALTFDLGWNPAAYPRIEVRGGRGGEVFDCAYGTAPGPDNRPAVTPGACDRFIAAPGECAWQSFLPRGYRYHTVKVRADHPVTLRVGTVTTHHDVPDPLPFACSDEGLTKVWAVTDRTLRTSMLDAFVDNNWREQTQWLHDGCVGALGAWATYGDTILWRRLLRQTAQSAHVFPGGAVHAMPACDPVFQRSFMPICDYAATFLTSVEQFHAVTGDDDLLREVLPAVRGLVFRFIESGFTEEHLFIQPPGSKIFLDWTPRPFDKSPYNLTLNLSVLRGLESAGYLADAAEDAELAEHCRRRSAELREAVLTRFWSDEHHGWNEHIEPSEQVKRGVIDQLPEGWLEDPWQPTVLAWAANKEPTACTRHGNALAVLLRLGSPDQQAEAAKLVATAFDPNHACNNGMSPIWTDKIFGSLFEAGEDAEAIRLLQESYGKWASEGALHWGEGFGPGDAAQLCGSSVNWLLSGYVLGIRPGANGSVIFDPRPGSLSWAKGVVPTPHGNICVEWTRGADGIITATLTRPENILMNTTNGNIRVTYRAPHADDKLAAPIISRVAADTASPARPVQAFDVRSYGAVGDGQTVNTSNIQKTIDACHDAGGGTVFVPSTARTNMPSAVNETHEEQTRRSAMTTKNTIYGRPFATPTQTALIPLPAGAVEPQGWLRDRCLAARDGYTGHMDDVHEAFRQAWAADYTMTGDKLNSWQLGAWPYEGGGYWFEGLARLAYALNDAELKRQAEERLGIVAARMNDKGILFYWWLDRNRPEDVGAVNGEGKAMPMGAWPIWANGLFGRAMAAYCAASQSSRCLRSLVAGYNGSREWCHGAWTNVWPALEAYTWSGDAAIKARLTELFKDGGNDKVPFLGFSLDRYFRKPDSSAGTEDVHSVLLQEHAIIGALGYLWTGDREMYDTAVAWFDVVERQAMQPHGVIVGDEHFGPKGALRGTETCDVAGHLWSRLVLLMAGGDGAMADRIERAFFNAGAAAMAPDYLTHVYHQVPNRTADLGGQYSYNKHHDPLCCTAALNRILPYYVTHMWMATHDNGLVATHYGPCRLSALAGDNVPVRIDCRTNYPFNEVIDMSIALERPAAFPISLRIPGWCRQAGITVNGAPIPAEPDAKGFVRIERTWRDGDTIGLSFPMSVKVDTGLDINTINKTPCNVQREELRNGNVLPAAPYATVSYGPLLFALPIAESAADKNHNTPDSAAKWNYALDDVTGNGITVDRTDMPGQWDWPLESPLRLRVPAVPCDWSPNDYEPLPPDAVADGPRETLTLVPYGCTRFRVSMFPVTERAWRPHQRAWSDLTPFVKSLRVSRPLPASTGDDRTNYPADDAALGLEWKTFADAYCSVKPGPLHPPLEADWTVYGPIPAPQSNCASAPESWDSAPAAITVADVRFDGRRMRSVGGVLHVPDRSGPTLLAATVWDSEADGMLQIAFSADWWARWWINGQPAYSTFDKGNEFPPDTAPCSAHIFGAPVRRGPNLIVVQIAGGLGWGCRVAMEAALLPPRQVDATRNEQRVIYAASFVCSEPMRLEACLGYDGPTQVWIDGGIIYDDPDGSKIPMLPSAIRTPYPVTRIVPDAVCLGFEAPAGTHEIRIARGLLKDRDTGIFLRFKRTDMPVFSLAAKRPALPKLLTDSTQA